MTRPTRSGARRRSNRETLLSRWARLSRERSDSAGRTWLQDPTNNHVNYNLSAPWTHFDLVRAIAEQAKPPIRIEFLSPQLQTTVFSRARTVFGYAWDYIDQIACNYPNMYWWLSERGLTMDTIGPTPPIEDFEQIAGRFLSEMRRKFPGRLSRDQHLEVAAQIDQLNKFTPLEVLSQDLRAQLADWNQKHPNCAVKTFSEAIKAQQPKWVHLRILKRLYRAEDNFKRGR